MNLYAFPFAGGGEQCYRELSPYLDKAVLRTQALPGRGRLINKPCIRHMDEMTDHLMAGIVTELDRPYALFGHSMGAYLAFMLTKKIIAYGLPEPDRLILSGRRAPTVLEQEPKHQLPDDQFRKMLLELGGIPDIVWQDRELMALFEPIIRTDFELIEAFLYPQSEPVNIPIYLLMGTDDNVSHAEAKAWQKETTRSLSISYFSGGHFYFQHNWQELAKKINGILSSSQQCFNLL